MPNLDEMLRSFGMKNTEYYTFYLRGMLNAATPAFFPSDKRRITEEHVSGEYLETLRLVADRYAGNLEEGQSVSIGYKNVRDVFDVAGDYYKDFDANTMADVINNTLGAFRIKREDGQLIVDHDPYDFPPEFETAFTSETGKAPSMGDYISQGLSLYQKHGLSGEGMHKIAHLGGEYFMPDNQDDEDALKIRIAIPNEPAVIDVDYDDDIPEGATDFAFRGPMTNKRKDLFDSFLGIFSTEAQAAEASMPLPQSKPERTVDIPLPASKQSMLAKRDAMQAGQDEAFSEFSA